MKDLLMSGRGYALHRLNVVLKAISGLAFWLSLPGRLRSTMLYGRRFIDVRMEFVFLVDIY